MLILVTHRQCWRCKQLKLLNEFTPGRTRHCKAGRHTRCEMCFRQEVDERTRKRLIRQQINCFNADVAQNGQNAIDTRSSYFIENVGTGLVKIGKSFNVPQRLKQLQRDCSSPLRLLGVVATPENKLHQYFAADRVRGEWFRATPLLRAFIKHVAEFDSLPPPDQWDAIFIGVPV